MYKTIDLFVPVASQVSREQQPVWETHILRNEQNLAVGGQGSVVAGGSA